MAINDGTHTCTRSLPLFLSLTFCSSGTGWDGFRKLGNLFRIRRIYGGASTSGPAEIPAFMVPTKMFPAHSGLYLVGCCSTLEQIRAGRGATPSIL